MHFDRLREYLLRSRVAPLDVHLDLSLGQFIDGIPRYDVHVAATLSSILAPELERLRSIDVRFRDSTQAHKLLPLPGRLDSLTNVTVSHEANRYTDEPIPLITMDCVSPLRRLAIRGRLT